jgi:hypothetical protein
VVGALEKLNNAENNTLEILVPHVQKCVNSNRFEVIEIEHLLSVCTDICPSNNPSVHYVIENPNHCETD